MTTTLSARKTQEHSNDRLREARHHRRQVEVRRIAVIRPAGAHFKLRPIRASFQAAAAEEPRPPHGRPVSPSPWAYN
jgi:hypothetical protein